jgi:hypothetical protein
VIEIKRKITKKYLQVVYNEANTNRRFIEYKPIGPNQVATYLSFMIRFKAKTTIVFGYIL